MKIAPIDIAHKIFRRKFNGLDPEEVYEFMRDTAEQMEKVIRERNQLKEQVREKERSLAEYCQRDETLKATITTATKMTKHMKVDAEKEAELIRRDAEHRGEAIVREARESLKSIYQEISDMRQTRIQFEVNLRSLIQAHLAMLDQGQSIVAGAAKRAPQQRVARVKASAQPLSKPPAQKIDLEQI